MWRIHSLLFKVICSLYWAILYHYSHTSSCRRSLLHIQLIMLMKTV